MLVFCNFLGPIIWEKWWPTNFLGLYHDENEKQFLRRLQFSGGYINSSILAERHHRSPAVPLTLEPAGTESEAASG